jgi:glutaredoxin
MTMNRRILLTQLAASTLTLAVGSAWAAQPVVEIIAFAHPPVQAALKPLRDWLATQGSKLRVVEIDMESTEAEKRLKAIGLKGHIPVVVLVDGNYRHKRKDGSEVELVSFPAGPGTPAGVKGTWSAEDVQAALKSRKS